ncbi:MAG TPA: hypothetical protein VMF04_00545 [Thermoplasmata archaeon]|nr:hypothetical protein [Thermoplasmata archaeon]
MTDSAFSDSWRRHHRGPWAGLRRAFLATIAGGVGWVCFTLLYVAFWAHGFSLFQSIVVIIVSLLVLGALITGAWASFGMSWATRWDD